MTAKPAGDLDAALLSAHASHDVLGLIGLYTDAADQAPDAAARSFFLTHAYVFALEAGDPRAAELRSRLVQEGAETGHP